VEPGRRDTARSRAIRALAWLSLALVSCLDASFLSAPSAVGPQGGAFTFAGGAVVLQVPPGAVAQPVGLSVEPARAFTPSELVVPGSVFELHPVGLRLAVPVSLSLRYRTSALPAIVDESELRVFRATGEGWVPVAGGAPAAAGGGTVTAPIDLLSVYGVRGVSVATVSVTPDTVAVASGEVAQLRATARDADGNILPRRRITWSSSDPERVRVDATGLVLAQTGGAVITATSEGRSGSALVRVLPPPVKPFLEEDFSKYATTADLLANGPGLYLPSEDIRLDRIALDADVALGGARASMRYDFPDRSSDAGRCTDFSISRSLGFGRHTSEVWVEVWARFEDDFRTPAPSSWGCASSAAYKFVFGLVPTTNRFDLRGGVFGDRWDAGYPGNEDALLGVPSPFGSGFDGQWHVYRFHWKVSTTASSADGSYDLWMDGVPVARLDGRSMQDQSGAPVVLYGVALGRNINQGPDHLQSLWWGRIRAWDTNPGW